MADTIIGEQIANTIRGHNTLMTLVALERDATNISVTVAAVFTNSIAQNLFNNGSVSLDGSHISIQFKRNEFKEELTLTFDVQLNLTEPFDKRTLTEASNMY